MPSDLKSETARANGAKSHGPKTPEGREKSSQNAVKHGFTSKSIIVLDTEDPEEFHEVENEFVQTYRPAGPAQENLVREMVGARWRIRRMMMIETCMFNSEIDNQQTKSDTTDPGVLLAAAFRSLADDSRALALAIRYESRLQRLHDRAHKTLRELQQNCPPTQPTDSAPPPPAESSPTENCETNPGTQAPTEPRASASGPKPVVPIEIRTRHTPRRSSFQRARRGYRFYLAVRRRTAGRLSYNESLLQATRCE
jgi:hypothetical protein